MNLAFIRYRLLLRPLALFLNALFLSALFLGLLIVGILPGCASAGGGPGGAGAVPGAVAEAPRWPLDLPARWLTSSFMEYRGGRFHAGIDFKTRETEGFPAFAVEDGSVTRVRTAPNGYGRVVYLLGDSGRTYVYAHLARFNDAIGERIRTAQSLYGSYTVEMALAPGEMPVRRGEVLGLTGQSGTLGPHLHFEVRDGEGRPLDPQACGFAVRDTIAPVIHHVRALAAAATTRLPGGSTAALLERGAGGAFPGPAAVLEAVGPVAFSALVIDASDPAGHKLDPWLLELRLDGRVVYRRANESFDFAENAQQRLEWLECGGLREQWLHRDPAVHVAGRQGEQWFLGADGRGLEPGRHALELAAVDRAGNRSTVAWDLNVLDAGGEPDPAPGAWKPVDVARRLKGISSHDICLAPLFDVIPEAAVDDVVRWEPEPDSPVLAPFTLAWSPFEAPTAADLARAREQGLTPAGAPMTWEAAAWPLAYALLLPLPPGALDAPPTVATGIYRKDGESWAWEGPIRPGPEDDGWPHFELPRPGLYAAFDDTVPPAIASADLTAGPHPGFAVAAPGVTPPRWQVLAVAARDAGAGVDAGSLAALWDGEPLVVEPDLLRERLLVEVPDAAAPGRHRLSLEVSDRAGNRTLVVIGVACVQAPASAR